VRYQWGENLARGKPYTVQGAQDHRNSDGGGDLTDGIIAPPDTYVSEKYMPTNVFFAQDVSPVVTLDLGGEPTVSAVRVHAGQEGGFHLTYPDAITVDISTDGQTFQAVGAAEFTQVFTPPADFVPWELDESLLFADLPAGGRLAYAFPIFLEHPTPARYVRIRCTARQGWGMLLSEVQVLRDFTEDRDPPPLVALPPLADQVSGTFLHRRKKVPDTFVTR
jgi:hypothetical protein